MRVPAERIKRNYDETSLQQLALEIENAAEARLANSDPRTHANFHVDRGRELLGQGFNGEAARNFREAIQLDPANAGAHAGLAQVLEADNDTAGARSEAEAALRLSPTADAYLVLARLEMKANQAEDAEHNVDLALAMDPKNSAALALKNQLRSNKKSE